MAENVIIEANLKKKFRLFAEKHHFDIQFDDAKRKIYFFQFNEVVSTLDYQFLEELGRSGILN